MWLSHELTQRRSNVSAMQKLTPRKHLAPFALIAVGALALAGCSSSEDPSDAGEAPRGTAESPAASEPIDESTGGGGEFDERDVRGQELDIDHERAVEIALEEAGGGIVFSIELDHSRHHGEWVYEIEVLDGSDEHDFDISATSGEVLEHDRDSEDDTEQEVTFEMTPAEALDLAAGQLADGDIVEGWTLSWDDGQLEYEIDVEPGEDLIIDVATGDIRED